MFESQANKDAAESPCLKINPDLLPDKGGYPIDLPPKYNFGERNPLTGTFTFNGGNNLFRERGTEILPTGDKLTQTDSRQELRLLNGTAIIATSDGQVSIEADGKKTELGKPTVYIGKQGQEVTTYSVPNGSLVVDGGQMTYYGTDGVQVNIGRNGINGITRSTYIDGAIKNRGDIIYKTPQNEFETFEIPPIYK